MHYSDSPIRFVNDEQLNLQIDRPLSNVVSVIDNWVDTVVFTSIRRFKADEEFGFSFWDNEFIAMNLVDFNHGADFKIVKRKNNREEKVQMSRAGIRQCERSVRDSILYYIPYLKNLEVGYSFPKSLLSKAHIGSLRVYVSGYNLLTFDSLDVLDPETTNTLSPSYPLIRVVNFGLKLGF